MPFKSLAQSRMMFAKHPKMAKEMSSKTDYTDLPERAKMRKAVAAKKKKRG